MNQAEALATIAVAKQRIERQEAVGSTKAGWLMVAALLVESWDSYSLSFVLVFLRSIYHLDAWLLGFIAAGVHLGALVGALLGGWATDYFGRRKIFLTSMILFIICALVQGVVPTMWALAVVRLIGGIPIGCDIANGFTYIMEVLPKEKREVMGNRWQFMLALGAAIAIVLVTILKIAGVTPDLLWRMVLMVPAIPAAVLLIMRTELPETPAWLLERGRFRDAKIASRKLHGDLLDYLPDENVKVRRPTAIEAVRDVWGDKVRRRGTILAGLPASPGRPSSTRSGFTSRSSWSASDSPRSCGTTCS